MSATRPATEFSIGIMPMSASPDVMAAKQSSKVAQGTASAAGYTSRIARCEFAPGSPWNTTRLGLIMRFSCGLVRRSSHHIVVEHVRELQTTHYTLGGRDRIDEQHRHCHGADPARNTCDVGRFLADTVKIDVSSQLAILTPVDADVDDDGIGLHHFSDNEVAPPGRDHKDVSQNRELREITRFRVTNAHSRVPLHEH